MVTESLQTHLEQGRDALIKAALNGTTKSVPLEQIKEAVSFLTENGALSPEVGVGILLVDGRVKTEAGRRTTT